MKASHWASVHGRSEDSSCMNCVSISAKLFVIAGTLQRLAPGDASRPKFPPHLRPEAWHNRRRRTTVHMAESPGISMTGRAGRVVAMPARAVSDALPRLHEILQFCVMETPRG